MQDYKNMMTQAAAGLQPILFAPKHACGMNPESGWRRDEFDRREANGELTFANESAREAVLEALRKAGSDADAQFHTMQLLAFLLNGAINACVHNGDISDAMVSESMLYATAMRLTRNEADELCNLVTVFASDVQDVLKNQFGVPSKLTGAEMKLLNDMKLLRWE